MKLGSKRNRVEFQKYNYTGVVADILEDNGAEKPYDLAERLFQFAVNVVKITRNLPKSKEYSVITYQLVKSATSVGANYEEAQAAVSKADFANKVGIALKECRETTYWIRLILEITEENTERKESKNEAFQLQKILGAIYSKVSVRR